MSKKFYNIFFHVYIQQQRDYENYACGIHTDCVKPFSGNAKVWKFLSI